MVNEIMAHPSVKVLRIKNRFRNPTPAGYRDIMMNLLIEDGEIKHIAELQVHHKEVKNFFSSKRNGNSDAHMHYEYFREYFAGQMEAVEKRMVRKRFDNSSLYG